MHAETYRRLIDYNFWAHQRVWACVMALSEEQFTRPCDYSVGSVHAQVVHTMGAEWMLFQRLFGHSPKAIAPAADYPTRELIRQRWDDIESEIRTYLDTLDDEQLMQQVTYVSISGNAQRTNYRWEILSQLINHSTDHRAQILALIHQAGGETIEQDLIFYTWENPL